MDFIIWIIAALLLALLAFPKHLIKLPGEDFKLMSSKDGRKIIVKERHDLHFVYTALIAMTIVFLGYAIGALQFDRLQWYFYPVAFLILGAIGNAAREGYKQHKGGKESNGIHRVPYDPRDVRFGDYGGCIGGFIGCMLGLAFLLLFL